jgi:hypothetical protein
MNEPDSAPQITNLDELLTFRETTERISGLLNKRLRDHLTTLSLLLAPGRVLGKYVGAREAAPRADEALAELSEKYTASCGSPFDLKPELDEEALTSIGAGIRVYPYEYSYEARGGQSARKITMTSPVRWAVSYGTDYSLSQMRSLAQAPSERQTQPIRQFVVSALAFQVVLARNAGVSQLLKDLRYEIATQALSGLEKLPLAVFSVQLPSFRPPDELLLTATRLSGVPAFIELIDTTAVQRIEDPLRLAIEAL